MPIDGKDDRYNYWDNEVSNEQRKNADCVGMIVPVKSLKKNHDGTFRLKTISYGENCGLCCKDKFYNEQIICGGIGTCFAIHSKENNLVVTARHVIDVAIELGYIKTINDFIREYCVLFGYVTGQSVKNFPKENVYYLKSEHNNTYSRRDRKPENDFTILKVTREIRNKVLLHNNRGSAVINADTYISGHPLKMPLKITLNCKVKEEKSMMNDSGCNENYFTVSADAFLYSSGSPVFDSTNHKILGMLTSNANGTDFIYTVSACSCKENKRDYRILEEGTSSNFILKINSIEEKV